MIEGTLDRPVEDRTVAAGPADEGAGEPFASDGEVARAADRWADEVSRLGGRNTLLRFQDLKAGTLDLAAAEPEARKELLDGVPVLAGRLFPHEPLRSSALRSTRALHLKVRELAEERGIWTGHLAIGIATWAEPYAARRPAVPVFLRRLSIEPASPAEQDFLLTVAPEPQVNPVLLLAMATRVGIRLGPDDLRDPRGRLRYPYVVDRLREYAPAHVVDGFAIAHRAVLGTFTDTVLETAASLRAEAGRLAEHPMARLLAEVDPAAAEPAWNGSTGPLVLPVDLDDDQAASAEAVVRGGSSVVLAGPGTGLTRTLVGAVAGLVAEGRTVLVTAEPRAPLADLAAALHRIGLGEAVLDLHAEVSDGDALEAVRSSVAAATSTPVPQAGTVDASDPAGQLLEAHVAWSRSPLAPWGTSPYEVQLRLLAARDGLPTRLELSAEVVRRLHGPVLERVCVALAELADSGGLDPGGQSSAWDGAHLDDEAAAAAAVAAARRLLDETVPAARDAVTRAAVELGHPVPATLGEALDLVELLDAVRDTLGTFLPEVWSAPLDELAGATGDRGWRADHPGGPSLVSRRGLRRAARELRLDPERGPDGAELHAAVVAARDRLLRWRRSARDDRPPRLTEHSVAAITAGAVAGADLLVLEAALPDARLGDLPYAELSRRLTALLRDEGAAARMPRLRGLRRELAEVGLGPLVAELTRFGAGRAQALAALDRLWLVGVLAAARGSDPVRAVADPDALVARFAAAQDAAHAAVALETRRRHALALRTAAVDPVERAALDGARTLSAALAAAPALVGAARPVWLVPTLRVAQSVPAAHQFDLAVVEAAHLVDAPSTIPALTRARRVVVAGDPVGVPPVEFSVAAEPEVEPEVDATGVGGRALVGSLLHAVWGWLPSTRLTRHYRCADERLVRSAATQLPGSELAAWPGSDGGRALRLDLVTQPPLVPRQEESVGAEVAHVVDLVLDSARNRPERSLAVITLGARHAERVREAVRAALLDARELEPFFSLDRPEPFVVLSLDHVRAEVRDDVVISVGYGRTAEGRLLYRFGSLGAEGGERRLATATTRARESLVVVSTFRGIDMNPRRLLANGPRLLRELLVMADSVGSQAPDSGSGTAATSATGEGERRLREAVVRRLRAAGLPVQTEVGYGPLRVEVALRDPDPAGPDLAVLLDGDVSASARERELVVPRHLERLGWRVVRVWTSRWVADPSAEVARVVAAWEAARRPAPVAEPAAASAPGGVPADTAPAATTVDAGEPASRAPDAAATADPGRAQDAAATVEPAHTQDGAAARTGDAAAPGPVDESAGPAAPREPAVQRDGTSAAGAGVLSNQDATAGAGGEPASADAGALSAERAGDGAAAED